MHLVASIHMFVCLSALSRLHRFFFDCPQVWSQIRQYLQSEKIVCISVIRGLLSHDSLADVVDRLLILCVDNN